MAGLLDTYRDAWRDAGHPGEGQIMLSFSMHVNEDGDAARAAFGSNLDSYLDALVDGASGWLDGASTKDYPGYDRIIAELNNDSFDAQVARGIAWVGAPDEVADMMADYLDGLGNVATASLHILPHRTDYDAAEDSMRLFSEKVMPRFR
jgi:alkanesulfonate monooxygenase SsuD/methylene tetrahydromethanopterin reductase-like flavin-dependent oxidoreductase (luciferase family)